MAGIPSVPRVTSTSLPMNFDGIAARMYRDAGISISLTRKTTAPTASADRLAT